MSFPFSPLTVELVKVIYSAMASLLYQPQSKITVANFHFSK